MHPVLLTLPLPGWPIPLGTAFVVLALVSLAVALLGRRGAARDLTVLGVLAGVVALGLALRFRGQTLRLESVPVYSFGALLAAAVLVGTLVTRRLARRESLAATAVDATSVASVAAGFVGARLVYVATNPGDLASVGDILALGQGGLALSGGLLGGVLGAFAYLKRNKIRAAAFADAAAPGAVLGLSIGHLGSYLAGADYGRPLGDGAPRWLARLGTFSRWSDASIPGAGGPPVLVDQVLSGQLDVDSVTSLPVHPTQLYEATGALGLAVGLFLLTSRRPFRGAVALVALGAHAALHFSVETLRADPERGFAGPSISARWTGGLLVLLVGALVWLLVASGRHVRGGGPARRRAAALVAIGVVTVLYALLRRWTSTSVPTPVSVSQWTALGCLAFTVPAFAVLAGGGWGGPPRNERPFTPGAPPS